MLGAEGVKKRIISRLKASMPAGIEAVAHEAGVDPRAIPAPKVYYPSRILPRSLPADRFPAVSVFVEETDGDLGTGIANPGAKVEQFQIRYNVTIGVHTMVANSGSLKATLEAERLVSAVLRSLMWKRILVGDGKDSATVGAIDWRLEFDSNPFDDEMNAWLGFAGTTVKISTNEFFDHAPFRDTPAYLTGFEVYAQDPVTGEDIQSTIDDEYDGPTPKPAHIP